MTTVLIPPRTEKSPMTVIRLGLHDLDEFVEDAVGHRLVEDPLVPELDHVVLQRLQLEAALVGDVGDQDLAEIGKAGLGTDRRELGAPDLDLVIALGLRVRESLQRLLGMSQNCSIHGLFFMSAGVPRLTP